ncbi:TPA: conjugal transfer protein [Enterococcus faecalis]
MLKVKVVDLPVFYDGKRYLNDEELVIKKEHFNEDLFELLEENDVEENPYKGVKEISLKKALTEAGIEIPDGASRDVLIELLEENELSI